jgi:hypothetical protein
MKFHIQQGDSGGSRHNEYEISYLAGWFRRQCAQRVLNFISSRVILAAVGITSMKFHIQQGGSGGSGHNEYEISYPAEWFRRQWAQRV